LGTFSIKDIESITGIKSHNIRIWEQRYGLLKPKRNNNNVRYFDDEDLKLLLNISQVYNTGKRISEIAKMPVEEICKLALSLSKQTNNSETLFNDLLTSALRFDETEFQHKINSTIEELGIIKSFENVFFPFLSHVGNLWQAGSVCVCHEHFSSNMILNKLNAIINSLEVNTGAWSQRFLLFLPAEEKHTLGLTYARYIVKSNGHEVIYLGDEVPLKHLETIKNTSPPNYLITSITTLLNLDFKNFIGTLVAQWPESRIIIGGGGNIPGEIEIPDNVNIMPSFEELRSFLSGLKPSWKRNED